MGSRQWRGRSHKNLARVHKVIGIAKKMQTKKNIKILVMHTQLIYRNLFEQTDQYSYERFNYVSFKFMGQVSHCSILR